MQDASGAGATPRHTGLLREQLALNLDEKNNQAAFRQPRFLVLGAA